MLIEKNWFYRLSQWEESKITIAPNQIVTLFDDVKSNIQLELWENARVELYWFYDCVWGKNNKNIHVIQSDIDSKFLCKYMIFSDQKDQSHIKILSELDANQTLSDVKILSIAWKQGNISVDGSIKIDSWVEKVDANLDEENLFLWESWQIHGVPTLLVRSDDVKASHACKMEKISDEKLFYLRSRGIGRENALSMMIEAKIKSLFQCITMLDNDFYEQLLDEILKRVQD